jgi:hypothetical protein
VCVIENKWASVAHKIMYDSTNIKGGKDLRNSQKNKAVSGFKFNYYLSIQR